MLIFLIGPPAVGKMTVGDALARRTGLRLFHNHLTIDLVLRFFPFGTSAFGRLVGEFRRRVFEEVAASDLPGIIFTDVWAFEDPKEQEYVDACAGIFRSRGGRVIFVELQTTQAERLKRNETAFRLAEKPFKRDLEASQQRLLVDDANHQLDSRGALDGRPDYLYIDNSAVSASECADRIIAHFHLRQVSESNQSPPAIRPAGG
jgi:hypothetical protein